MDTKEFNERAFNTLKTAVEVVADSMQMSIEQEDYKEFFETFGNIYIKLSDEFTYAVKNNTGYSDKLWNLIYSHLIPNSVDIMKKGYVLYR